jgi:secreted PhoX family phosphatase
LRDSFDNSSCNGSGNRGFGDILQAGLSRRTVLAGGLAAVSTTFLTQPGNLAARASDNPLVGFEPVALKDGKGPAPAISEDYEYQVLIPWGTPLQPGGPAFRHPPNAADQAEQIGIGHDGVAYFPLPAPGNGVSNQGMLAINHEFGTNQHVLGKRSPNSLDDVRTSQHAHGVSVVEIREVDGRWETVKSARARRVHANTPVRFGGPAAGHALLRNAAGNAPAGTLGNCANGRTPWGTYLTCEENFQGFFAASGRWTATEEQKRYGFDDEGYRYGWNRFDPRFDLSNADYANEGNRFGWVVEIDPMDVSRVPVKRTALGRFRHESAAVVEGENGRIVVYMGDDQRFNYIYKFVSDGDWRAMLRDGRHPLDHGTLYVATFFEDGSGEWRALTIDNREIAARLADQAAVLTYARIAADIVGATPMDRPEWTTVAPNGDVYCALTNNIMRWKTGPASPMAPNADGHIVRWRDAENHIGLTFRWDVFLLARDTHATEASFSDPDGLWADPDGRLFIETDGRQKDGLNNQLLVADTRTGEIRRLFTGLPGDEITGLTTTPDRRTLFCNTQHPGKGDPSVTNFPTARDGTTVPRDCTFAIRRKDGGIVGS